METIFFIDQYGLTELEEKDVLLFSGGHNGVAYKIGYALGEGIRKTGEVVGLVALIAAYLVLPKS